MAYLGTNLWEMHGNTAAHLQHSGDIVLAPPYVIERVAAPPHCDLIPALDLAG
jgi:hypothetical protein